MVTGSSVTSCARMVAPPSLPSASEPTASRREDTSQAVVATPTPNHSTLPHASTGFLHRRVPRQYKPLLVFDDIRELSIGHKCLRFTGRWGHEDRLPRTPIYLPHWAHMGLDPRQALLGETLRRPAEAILEMSALAQKQTWPAEWTCPDRLAHDFGISRDSTAGKREFSGRGSTAFRYRPRTSP